MRQTKRKVEDIFVHLCLPASIEKKHSSIAFY